MDTGALPRTKLWRFLCQTAEGSQRQALVGAAAEAILEGAGAGRAWARLQEASAVAPPGAGALPGVGDPDAVEMPVELAGRVCGAVGVEGEAVGDSLRRRAAQVAETLATWEARRRLSELCRSLGRDEALVGCSPGILEVERLVRRVAPLDEPVLIQGETGVGKELVARMLHCLSCRSRQPLWVINCAAVPEELLVTELFGHQRGSFTGAVRTQRGRFEVADGATLFLDEVADLGPRLQAALLRVLEHGEIQRLGDEGRSRRVNVRVLAASNRDLEAEVAAGRFRGDLYYRLSPLAIRVPPLRERLEDVPVLANHFIVRLERRWGRSLGELRQVMEVLVSRPLPGNVRELRNLILRAAVGCVIGDLRGGRPWPWLGPEAQVRLVANGDGAPPAGGNGATGAGGNGHGAPEDLRLRTVLASHLERVLHLAGGNVSRAARILDIPRTTLQSKLERYGVAR